MNIKIGTRGSKLALTQANLVADSLTKTDPGITVEICVIKTSGDIMQDVALTKIGGKGVFVKEIEDALLCGTIDLAVHSMKDVPTEIPAGLTFAAILRREDARDILVSKDNRKMEFMPRGARIGTGSMRRSAQLLAILPDLAIVPLRGNLETRLKKIQTENLQGIILAAAGMKRLGFAEKISQYLPIETMLPAVGQGALGLELRDGNNDLMEVLAKLNHAPTAAEITAERSFLRHLGGGCLLPIAAFGKLEGEKLTLEGLVAAPNGSSVIRDKVRGAIAEAEELGKRLAEIIIEKGGKKLLELGC
ncbi:MAG: hydroxymethylbilane synthase [Deltaproteobacteria bacterium]